MSPTATHPRTGNQPPTLYRIEGGRLVITPHEGQARAWRCTRRFVFVLAGTQGGKTSFGPLWLWREIQRKGPGDYLAVAPNFGVFKLKMLPALRDFLEYKLGVARYWASAKVLEIRDPTTGKFWAEQADDPMYARIILRSADAEGGLESASANAAWLDEAGQDNYTVAIWEAVLRRLSLSQGRVLATTTVYNLGWVKSRIYDRWRAGDPDIAVIHFDSLANPSFPKAEYYRAKREMPAWRFNMFYRGLFAKPAGLIYDCFDETVDKIKPFTIPNSWARYLGLDFGGVNTFGMFYAENPRSGEYIAYREYHGGRMTAAGHAAALLEGEPHITRVVGGSPSEGQWRDEFRAAGLAVYAPDVTDVFVGIDRAYKGHKTHRIKVFSTLQQYLDALNTYSYVLDEHGNAVEPLQIKDKAKYHPMDAERYIMSYLMKPEEEDDSEVAHMLSDYIGI